MSTSPPKTRTSTHSHHIDEKIVLGLEVIVKNLEATRHQTQEGCYWETIQVQGNREWKKGVSSTLYSGNAGIALFLVELANCIPKERYWSLAHQSLNWLKANCHYSHGGLYGDLGFLNPLLRLYHLQHDQVLKSEIKNLCEPLKDLKTGNIHELINGNSGTLIILLHLFQVLNEEWILDKILYLADSLVQSTKWDSHGLFWDSSSHQIKPLCGFSHGSSGIGFAFLELGSFLNRPEYFHISEMAFNYERHWLNKYGFWPDFRKSIEGLEPVYELYDSPGSANLNSFIEPRRMEAWCHGAPGIGLSRLHADSILGSPRIREDLHAAIEITKTIEKKANQLSLLEQNLTLCHGRTGNVDFLLEAGRYLNDSEALEISRIFIKDLCETVTEHSLLQNGYCATDLDDPSLFMGNTGIGYFLLRAYSNLSIPNILAPKLKPIPGSQSCKPLRRESLLHSHFPNTIHWIRKNQSKVLDDLNQPDKSLSQLPQLLNSLFSSFKIQDTAAHEIFNLEMKRWEMEKANPSFVLQKVKSILNEREVQNLLKNKGGLDNRQMLYTNSSIQLETYKSGTYAIWLQTCSAVTFKVDPLSSKILNLCQPGIEVSVLKRTILDAMVIDSESEERETHHLIELWILNALKKKLLVPKPF